MLSSEFRARRIAGVLLLTAITLRGAHFLGGVPWADAVVFAAGAGGTVDHLDAGRHCAMLLGSAAAAARSGSAAAR
jgi:hypothetical protein